MDMGCRCAERRDALAKAVTAVTDRDMQALADQARVFSKSVRDDVHDLRTGFRDRIAAARQSLMRR